LKKNAFAEAMAALAPKPGKPAKKKTAKEADAASAFPGAVRAKESARMVFNVSRLREADTGETQAPNRIPMVMIEEGMGNMHDAMFYTAGCIETGPAIFEGAKIFADHPDAISEETLPERSIRDVLGHWEDVNVQTSKEGQKQLCGTAVFIPGASAQWGVDMLRHAGTYSKKYTDKNFIGASINADGFIDRASTKEFLESNGLTLCAPVREKLEKALAEGVDALKVATAFKDAVSCDIVTTPGAGGRVKMLEQERKKAMLKNRILREADKEGKTGDGAATGHDDAAQDKVLIKSMLDKHLGAEDHSEETHKAASEAYAAAKEAGMDESEAEAAVGGAMKMAKVMGAKAAKESEAKAKEDEAAKEAAEVAEAAKAKEDEAAKESEAKAKESNKGKTDADKIIQLQGEVAALRESERKRNLATYLDKKLSETKLPRDVTKKFRESAKDIRDEKDVDGKLSMFMEAFRIGGGAVGAADESGYVTGHEKTGEQTAAGAGFADCAAD